jgi:imidazoleglycerol-phosphate dehydratase
MSRRASLDRKTSETAIQIELTIDGRGESTIATKIPFFDHMLTLFARHSLVDLRVQADGDIEVDFHHTVEDTGIALGQAFTKALGDKRGIRRYGSAYLPMDETLSRVVVDFSGRPF